MIIKQISSGPLDNNIYIISNDQKQAIMIDTASDMSAAFKYIKENDLTLLSLLLTHGHFDHIAGAHEVQNLGAKIYMHENDLFKINQSDSMASMLGISVQPFIVDKVIKNEETINIEDFSIQVIYTPGHTEGGVCYLIENNLFSGDTLFKDSFGRVDFFDSSPDKMISSLLKLYKLNGDIIVYPGHGEKTTILREKTNNLAALI